MVDPRAARAAVSGSLNHQCQFLGSQLYGSVAPGLARSRRVVMTACEAAADGVTAAGAVADVGDGRRAALYTLKEEIGEGVYGRRVYSTGSGGDLGGEDIKSVGVGQATWAHAPPKRSHPQKSTHTVYTQMTNNVQPKSMYNIKTLRIFKRISRRGGCVRPMLPRRPCRNCR